jgi:diguanylate cyclase (GGDEF)-like protein
MTEKDTPKGNRILVVDDTPANIDVLRLTLEPEGYDLSVAPSGEMALKIAPRFVPDLILLDIMMPGINGFETCEQLKKDPKLKKIPVIFISAKSEIEDIIEGFKHGGVDYISKPFRQEEVLARVKTHLKIKNLTQEKEQLIEELEETNKKLKDLAVIDPMTSLFNRRGMQELLEDEESRFNRNSKVFSLILIDIDYFKKINDSLGHEGGDHVLVQVSKFLQAVTRKHDKICRWGGEEFLLLLPETNLKGANVLAEKIRSGLASETFSYGKAGLSLTVSMGVSVYDDRDLSLKTCIRKADDGLYQAKAEGRNRIVSQSSTPLTD